MSTSPAGALHCPACGAPAAPEAARCEYCRARLATVSCPSCFSHLFDGTAYCPHCGAARSRSEHQSKAAETRCPACRGAMRWILVGAADLLECEGCDGIWVEAATFERLCADRESQAAVLHTNAGDRPAEIARAGPVRYRPCLRCGKMMNRLNFGRLSGAVVDVCRGHGTFLDHGELHQVVSFIQEGGMDRARDAQREQLREEQRRLQNIQRDRTSVTPASSSLSWDGRALNEFLSGLFGR